MKVAKIQSTTLLLDANNSPLALGLEEEHLEPSSNAQDKKNFFWKATHNALTTRDNLQKIGFILDTICLRSGAPKIVPHILFQCPFAIETWNICPWVHSFSLNQDTDFKTTFQASHKWHNLPLLGFTTNPFLWFWWMLWTSRKLCVFQNRFSTPQKASSKLSSTLKNGKEHMSLAVKPFSHIGNHHKIHIYHLKQSFLTMMTSEKQIQKRLA